MKLNWKKIWDSFEKWEDKNRRLEKYGYGDEFECPDWNEQQRTIQRIVQKELQQTECPYCGHRPDDY